MICSPYLYTKRVLCAICEKRRPRRFCPGVHGEICSLCCGEEREVSISCPFDCEFLRDARLHEKAPALDVSQAPNKDIRLTERFVDEHQELLMFVGLALLGGAMESDGAVDFDVREALESLIRTYRTLQSGVYYETLPANPLAARVHRAVQSAVDDLRRKEQERFGMSKTRDADVLGSLAFLQRLEFDRNNGRKRGRAFLDFLREIYASAPPPAEEAPPSLILP